MARAAVPRPAVLAERESLHGIVERLRAQDGVLSVAWARPVRRGKTLSRPGLTVHVRWKREKRDVPKGEMLPRSIDGIPIDVVELVRPKTLADGFFDATDHVEATSPFRKSTLTLMHVGADVLALVSGHGTLAVHGQGFVLRPGDRVNLRDPVLGRATGQPVSGKVGPGYDFAYVKFPPAVLAEWRGWHEAAGIAPIKLRTTPLVHGETLRHFSRLPDRRRLVTGQYVGDVLHDVELEDSSVGRLNLGWLRLVSGKHENFAKRGDSGSLVVDSQHRAVGVLVGSSGDHNTAYVMSLAGASFLDAGSFQRLFVAG